VYVYVWVCVHTWVCVYNLRVRALSLCVHVHIHRCMYIQSINIYYKGGWTCTEFTSAFWMSYVIYPWVMSRMNAPCHRCAGPAWVPLMEPEYQHLSLHCTCCAADRVCSRCQHYRYLQCPVYIYMYIYINVYSYIMYIYMYVYVYMYIYLNESYYTSALDVNSTGICSFHS